ncbi:MAG: M14 family metallopeptidase [Acidobacteriia bacterium]|nr:M14 family metallopeptidase [Terriglobia bacterium]
MNSRKIFCCLLLVSLLVLASVGPLTAKTPAKTIAPKITAPQEALGFNIGDDYHMATYSQLEVYWKKLAQESDRMKLVDIGPTAEGRRQYMAIITSPANLRKLDRYKEIARRLALAEGLTDDQAHALAREGKAVVWIDGGLHATETVGSQQLMEMVYQMVTRTDAETLRFLEDDILLCVLANPDGQELVANWYMREKDPSKRSMAGLPRLYHKYVGHDDNRDSYMSNMPETANMNRQLFIEWFPQIMYNHHQTGPAGAVVFIPPFRDPFNYHFDPLVPLGIEAVGTAMHSRLVAEGKGGSAMRSGSSYSTWWDGGLRTTVYFHNMIGILTEIIGNPTPLRIPLVADKQLPQGDWPLPIAPQEWHYRQSIDYEIEQNRAVLDYASRNRETLLYDIYQMGKNSIQRGSEDSWTVTPKRIEALKAAAKETPAPGQRGGGAAESGGDVPAAMAAAFRAQTIPADLYAKILHDPKLRDPRGYIISSSQDDFPTATKFVNALLKNGITVWRANSDFTVAGKNYPAGSYIVKTAQAARPFILDMFEPQDHPNDFRYPGGPPIPPYDNAGWTLAYQMGVRFDRVLDGFDGPFAKLDGVQPMAPGKVFGTTTTGGYFISHRINNSFIVVNRLLKNHCDVYWLKRDLMENGQDLGAGMIWTPASSTALTILEQGAKELGVPVHAAASMPPGGAWKIQPVRIGLYDQYGGLMPSGWLRWLFEQFEFPYEVVYPQSLDAGNLKDRFDVLVFTDGAFRGITPSGRGGGGGFGGAINPENIPAEYRSWLGRITPDKTVPQLKKFVEAGGTVLTVGSSTSLAKLLGVPVGNYLTERDAEGKERPLAREKFYIPGSLVRVTIDNTNPLAYGMPSTADVDFDSSPVFRIIPDEKVKPSLVAWYSGSETLDSGWAWGQSYLDGGVAIAESSIGAGKVIVLGPEVTYRGQPHETFKFLFNGLFYGSAQDTTVAAK